MDPRSVLTGVLAETLRDVDPHRVTRETVVSLNLAARPPAVLAIGKAARPMLRGACDALAASGSAPVSMLAVAPDTDGGFPTGAVVIAGDHPIPGERSQSAADAIDRWIAAVPADADVLLLLSGGATSLIAAPVPPIGPSDLRSLFELLLGAGVDIVVMNAIRKRVLRHGAGRLARSLAPRPVHQLIVSDVLGDDPAYIGSGPCTPDSLTAAKIWRMLERDRLLDAVPASVRQYLDDVHHQRIPETPKPGAGVFKRVQTRIILSNRDAVAAAARFAAAAGCEPVRVISRAIGGEARDVGTELAARLVAWRQQLTGGGASAGTTACTVAGGETTVTLGALPGRGGRCQELALAAARELHRLRPRSDGIALLAAGTDGRDGPTDAAGAIVDASTWSRIVAAGRDPEQDLARHDAYDALTAADALVRTGLTGTNVNDVIVATVRVEPR